jgi:hypothetical protein
LKERFLPEQKTRQKIPPNAGQSTLSKDGQTQIRHDTSLSSRTTFQGLISYFHRRVNGDLILRGLPKTTVRNFEAESGQNLLSLKYDLYSKYPGRRTKGAEVYAPISSRQGLLLEFLGTR